MKHISLTPRLAEVAAQVTPGARVIDVGTDHGFIPVSLLQNGVSPRVFVSDIAPGPLNRARASARLYGLEDKMEFLLCDGLEKCPPGDVDEIIIAGIGGEVTAGILERAPWAREKRLILQPMSKAEVLRAWLTESGCKIDRERLVLDSGKIYNVLAATGGADSKPLSEAELLTGRNGEPVALYIEYIGLRAQGLRRAIRGMESSLSPRPQDTARLEKMRSALAGIEEMLEGYSNAGRR